jgi:hypothetical protein
MISSEYHIEPESFYITLETNRVLNQDSLSLSLQDLGLAKKPYSEAWLVSPQLELLLSWSSDSRHQTVHLRGLSGQIR